jgi:alkylation response protein AidB-like acyl-CoA dehydrogenase
VAALVAAFMPGASPPLASIPMRTVSPSRIGSQVRNHPFPVHSTVAKSLTMLVVVDMDRLRARAGKWYEDNWDASVPVGTWFRTMFESGWAYPTWPEPWGSGLSTSEARIVREERRRVGALGPPSGIGPTLLAPMLFAHASAAQCRRYLPALAYGNETCSQMLSEPDAGSDLAGVRTRAERDGDEWVINGSKIWTSNADFVDFGMLLARTDGSVPKHRGLTFFLIRRDQPGVTVRPLRQMTGESRFNQVFFDDARVGTADVLGEVGNGWSVTRTFLAHEKNSYNPASHEGGPFSNVDLSLTAGEVQAHHRARVQAAAQGRGIGQVLDELLEQFDGRDNPLLRQRTAQLTIQRRIMTFTNRRTQSGDMFVGPVSKLSVSDLTRGQRDLGLAVQGAQGMLAGDDSASAQFAHFALHTPSLSIAGGTDQIQRNTLGERVLGLPSEPRFDRDLAFDQLPN